MKWLTNMWNTTLKCTQTELPMAKEILEPIEELVKEPTVGEKAFKRVELLVLKLLGYRENTSYKYLTYESTTSCSICMPYNYTHKYTICTELGSRTIEIYEEQGTRYYNCSPKYYMRKHTISFLENDCTLYSIVLNYDKQSLNIKPNLDGSEPMTEEQIYSSFTEIENIANEALEELENKRVNERKLKIKHEENVGKFVNRFNND